MNIQAHHIIDNHGSGYLGMAKGFNVTRQISGRLSKILPQLQYDIAENNYITFFYSLYSLYYSNFRLPSHSCTLQWVFELTALYRILFWLTK